jgi:hypothetical protein
MRAFIFLSISLIVSLALRAQTTVLSAGGASSLTIKSGTIFSADSLVLTPGSDFTLSSNNIQVSHTAVNLAPSPGINRAYYFGSQVNYTGTIQLYYQPSELNGNPESALKYTDSATGSFWLAAASSTVNTATHFVQYSASARNFIAATASHQGAVLPLVLLSFTGSWQGNSIPLQWVVEQIGEPLNFIAYSSTDAATWQPAGTVSGVPSAGVYTYYFTDVRPAGNPMFYKIALEHPSGETTYSGIVAVHKPGGNENVLRLVTGNNSAHACFDGTTPSAIRVVNSIGQVLYTDKTSRPRYDISGLSTGIYFLQYESGGQWTAREFLIP